VDLLVVDGVLGRAERDVELVVEGVVVLVVGVGRRMEEELLVGLEL
jgi:hypothetical protein